MAPTVWAVEQAERSGAQRGNEVGVYFGACFLACVMSNGRPPAPRSRLSESEWYVICVVLLLVSIGVVIHSCDLYCPFQLGSFLQRPKSNIFFLPGNETRVVKVLWEKRILCHHAIAYTPQLLCRQVKTYKNVPGTHNYVHTYINKCVRLHGLRRFLTFNHT